MFPGSGGNVTELNAKTVAHTIYVTKQCNLACAYCYQLGHHQPVHLSALRARDITRNILRSSKTKPWLEIFGGEPLLNQTAVEQVLQQCQNNRAIVSVFTNGVLIDTYWARRLREYGADVLISYDGRRGHDVFRRTRTNRPTEARVRSRIALLLAEGLNPLVCVALHRGNAQTIVGDVLQLYDIGVRRVKISNVNNQRFAVKRDASDRILVQLSNLLPPAGVLIIPHRGLPQRQNDWYYYDGANIKRQRPTDVGSWDAVGWN